MMYTIHGTRFKNGHRRRFSRSHFEAESPADARQEFLDRVSPLEDQFDITEVKPE